MGRKEKAKKMKCQTTCLLCRRRFWAKILPIEIEVWLENVIIKNLKTNEEVPYTQIKSWLSKETIEIIDNTVEVMRENKMHYTRIKVPLESLCLHCKSKLRRRISQSKRKPRSFHVIPKNHPRYFW